MDRAPSLFPATMIESPHVQKRGDYSFRDTLTPVLSWRALSKAERTRLIATHESLTSSSIRKRLRSQSQSKCRRLCAAHELTPDASLAGVIAGGNKTGIKSRREKQESQNFSTLFLSASLYRGWGESHSLNAPDNITQPLQSPPCYKNNLTETPT